MANKKPKTTTKKSKPVSKPKTESKTIAKDTEKPVSPKETAEEIKDTTTEEVEEVEEVAEVKETESTEKTDKAADKKVTKITAKDDEKIFKGFFAKKYEGKESILTIFKNPRFYGSIVGEILGSMFVVLLLFAISMMGIHNIAIYGFALIAVLIAVYAFSGANLNPLVTVGMMATRRMSVIRGIIYIIAQIVGAWLGWMVFNAFYLSGGDTAYAMTQMAEVAEGKFWVVTLIELLGAVIIGFFFARALAYKRSVFTFAAVVTGGMVLAILVGYIISAAFLGLSNNFIFNPAAALMFQIFPTAGESFGEVLGGICSALATYAVFPMLGGVIGFYLSDFASKLSGEKLQ